MSKKYLLLIIFCAVCGFLIHEHRPVHANVLGCSMYDSLHVSKDLQPGHKITREDLDAHWDLLPQKTGYTKPEQVIGKTVVKKIPAGKYIVADSIK